MFLFMLCFTICAISCLAFRFPITSHNELEIDLLCIFSFACRRETAIKQCQDEEMYENRFFSLQSLSKASECDLMHFSPPSIIVKATQLLFRSLNSGKNFLQARNQI